MSKEQDWQRIIFKLIYKKGDGNIIFFALGISMRWSRWNKELGFGYIIT